MRGLALILLVFVALPAAAQNEWADPPSAPWYQRTMPKNGGAVGHEIGGIRFGCLFTGSEIATGTDALMCFDKINKGAAIWLVGMKPTDCTQNTCRFFVGEKQHQLPLVQGAPSVWGLQKTGDKSLYQLVEMTGYQYTVSINTDKGDKTFAFTVPEEYRD